MVGANHLHMPSYFFMTFINVPNELGNIPRCSIILKFSDLKVVALSITREAFGFDSENFLFHLS